MLIAQGVLPAQTLAVEEFSKRLRELFGETGWDVAELVRRTGLSRGAVSRHLNGKAEPHYPIKVVYAQVLAKELGKNPEEILRPDRKEAERTTLTLPPELSQRIRTYASWVGAEPIRWLEGVVEFMKGTPPGTPTPDFTDPKAKGARPAGPAGRSAAADKAARAAAES
jgi:transcriptional regulator with XRE-family HTH domain